MFLTLQLPMASSHPGGIEPVTAATQPASVARAGWASERGRLEGTTTAQAAAIPDGASEDPLIEGTLGQRSKVSPPTSTADTWSPFTFDLAIVLLRGGGRALAYAPHEE